MGVMNEKRKTKEEKRGSLDVLHSSVFRSSLFLDRCYAAIFPDACDTDATIAEPLPAMPKKTLNVFHGPT
jgi:hypothetical protein